ncbi:MAG TPA: sugar nucleotide-binding protein [Marinagarivorans sp.]
MGFRILVISDSPAFYGALEAAFESLSFSLLAVTPDVLSMSSDNMRLYLEGERINIVVHASVVDIANLQNLTAQCSHKNLPLIHLSSYRVFGSHQEDLYEDLVPQPDDALGQDLLAAESTVLSCKHGLILRTPWTLVNFSQTQVDEGMLGRVCLGLLNNAVLNVSEAAAGTLVAWPEVAKTIVAIIQQIVCGAENWGVFHMHSSDVCSEAEFADAISRLLRAEGFCVAELSTSKSAAPYLVERTAVLKGRRCTENFGIQQRSFRVGLKGAVQRWVADNGFAPIGNNGT